MERFLRWDEKIFNTKNNTNIMVMQILFCHTRRQFVNQSEYLEIIALNLISIVSLIVSKVVDAHS